ncbi:Polymerase/histidinol phosphatase-like protein [Cokeromyces recurvatus]|uniref:Polymerase/histidinol phosphatase-like protein n=1 Tax=Cokeromyces recurvatus TaxID=90255 RepID=UPI00221F8E42|nr:Polymerase/histidinol phosphatase-like protein [Cokeromyces recurvatus]KAI7900302.1 Polymerase/histidinol phosphatase-like protein [Cokeromyces recurvatus]
MPYSFHSHSGQFCKHGYGQLEDVVKEAIRKGFHTYGLSEHMPRYTQSELYPEEIEAQCTPETLATAFHSFQTEARRLQDKYKDQINILMGAEIEFINSDYSQRIKEIRETYKLDYVVGSLHHVNSIPIDYSPELYHKALGDGDMKSFYIRYFDEQFAMLQAVQPEIVGHFDLIRIFADKDDTTIVDPKVWKCVVRNLDYVIAYGGLFEINSRAWKKGLHDAYPQRNIIQTILEKGGKFTLSDDCHGPNDVGLFYEKLQAYLTENKINTIYYLANENGQITVKEHQNILEDAFWKRIQNW